MHLVVSWDISASGDRHTEINDNLKAGLDGYSWARPLTTFYVVRINAESDREAIRDRLVKVAGGVSEKVHVVLSPVMAGGRYDGYLPKDMWDKLNQRSDP